MVAELETSIQFEMATVAVRIQPRPYNTRSLGNATSTSEVASLNGLEPESPQPDSSTMTGSFLSFHSPILRPQELVSMNGA